MIRRGPAAPLVSVAAESTAVSCRRSSVPRQAEFVGACGTRATLEALAAPGACPTLRARSVRHLLDHRHSGAHHKHLLVVAAAVSRKQQEAVIGGER